MNTRLDKPLENRTKSAANDFSQKDSGGGDSISQFVDGRMEARSQEVRQRIADESPQVQKAIQFQSLADHFIDSQSIQKKTENKTGLPDGLKSGIENVSGYSMNDVKVHYNSPKPAQLQAHAYAQGTDIHVATGQEKHLAHEAWHVVQQKQGRVQATAQRNGEKINDDLALEQEADKMGAIVNQPSRQATPPDPQDSGDVKNKVAQGVFTVLGEPAHRIIMERVEGYLATANPELIEELASIGYDDEVAGGELSEWLGRNGLDTSIVGTIPGEDAEEPEFIPVGEMFKRVAGEIGIGQKVILDMIVDLNLGPDIELARAFGDFRQHKKDRSAALKGGWEAWTSCFDTSHRLYDLLKNVPLMSYQAPAADEVGLQKAVIDLCSQIESIATESLRAVFRVNFGDADHSFTIIAQGANCEILQSFAGPAGESLAENIGKGKVYDTGTFCGLLSSIGAPQGERRNASNELFGGEIMLDADKNDLWPGLSISWSMSTLAPALEILQSLKVKMGANLEALKVLGVKL